MSMVLVDTHCHLTAEPLWTQLTDVLARAHARGVSTIIAPAYDVESWKQLAELGRLPHVHVAIGIHPWVATAGVDARQLRDVLQATQAVAVGEIGLDFKIPQFEREVQLQTLREQLAVAVDLDLPVLLHCRGAFEELLVELARFRPRGLIHAFSRGPELAERFTALGLHVAVGGAVTRPEARALKAVAKLPLTSLLLETDAPSIGLEGIAAAATEPQHVADIAQVVAKALKLPVAELAMRTTANAARLFGLSLAAPVSSQ